MGVRLTNHTSIFPYKRLCIENLQPVYIDRSPLSDKHIGLSLRAIVAKGNPYFDAIVPRAAKLTCTRPEFADLWASVMGNTWEPAAAVTDPADRQHLRDEIDALVAHLYGLSRADFDHILGTFPLVFPDDEAGQSKRDRLLDEYDRWSSQVQGWDRT